MDRLQILWDGRELPLTSRQRLIHAKLIELRRGVVEMRAGHITIHIKGKSVDVHLLVIEHADPDEIARSIEESLRRSSP